MDALETELDKLGHLYVLVQRLHASLSLVEVLEAASEAITNLIGSEDFAIFVRDSDTQRFEKVVQVGATAASTGPFAEGVGPLGVTAETGQLRFGNPIVAAVPLFGSRSERGCIGVIAVFSLLQHKQGLTDRDQELLRTLSTNAGVALEAAYFATEARSEFMSASRIKELIAQAKGEVHT